VSAEHKIGAEVLAREAVVYVRQSTLAQVRTNVESRERQYELVSRATALGWPAERVRVIDADLGLSGADISAREGFKGLVADVALGGVGIVIGLEASRLARSNAAWYQLLDLCSLTGTLIADADGVYDPADYSDRLVLGLKGTISESELHVLKGRLIAGVRHKAAKGELRLNLPAGYDYDANGALVMSPDESVRAAVREVFCRFSQLASIRQVTISLVEDGIQLPKRAGRGRTRWAPATVHAVRDMLVNPIYAGAYAYGRRQSLRRVGPDGEARTSIVAMPRDRWRVLILDHHEPYVSWDDHEAILAQITRNRNVAGQGGGPAREGQALLQGLVRCGRCGRRMCSAYSGSRGGSRRYYCDPREGAIARVAECQGMGGRQLDEAVLEEVFKVLEPSALQATAQALERAETDAACRLAVFETAVERARFEAERARRQFDACEPENRLVARNLEAVWEQRLREHQRAEADLVTARARRTTPLNPEELECLSRVGADLRAVFWAPTTSQRDRKLLLRALIAEVEITIDDAHTTARARIRWEGGATTELEPLTLRRQGQTYRQTDEEVIDTIRRLAAHYDDTTIASILARQRRRTATGRPFSADRVRQLRTSRHIPIYKPPVTPTCEDGDMVGVPTAAEALEISAATLYRWIRDGFVVAERPEPQAPWQIRLTDELRAKVADEVPLTSAECRQSGPGMLAFGLVAVS
jgi:DNA invertase Pin-like site-specific DNA recombinase